MSTTIRNGKLFCLNCGQSKELYLPQEMRKAAQNMIDFGEKHKKCKKTWTEPEPDMSQSEEDRAKWWLAHGEHGTSSLTLFVAIWGALITPAECRSLLSSGPGHPHDPGDFNRCYKLLKAVPEGKSKLHLAKGTLAWSNLIDNWDKLTEMLEEQIKTKKGNGMYAFMQTLIHPSKPENTKP